MIRNALLPLLIIALLPTGCSNPRVPAAPPSQVKDGLTVTLVTDTAHSGDNTLTVTLSDSLTQTPVGNANITATPNMLSPQLPGTPTSGRAQGNGVYNIPVRLGVATRYSLLLHIERPGQPATEITFPIEAMQ